MGEFSLIAASGEYSDFQYTMDLLHELVLDEHVKDDNAKLTAPEVRDALLAASEWGSASTCTCSES